MRTASHVIVESLVAQGIDRVFCVPGESHLGLLDALYGHPSIEVIACRHEAGAGFMAIADSRLTGRPGVCLVSRGPGASNAAIAVHTAQQDGVPLILLVGQVPRRNLRRDAFQEIDYRHMFGSIAKWTAEIVDPGRVGETMQRALHGASSGVPGPVVIALPEDLLTDASGDRPAAIAPARDLTLEAAPLRQLAGLIAASERPLVVAGGGFDRPGGREALLVLATGFQLPVAVSFRRNDIFPSDHPLFAGHLDLTIPRDQLAAFNDSDLVVALGTRMGDITSQGFRFPGRFHPGLRFVHIHQDPAILGAQFFTDLAIVGDAVASAEALGAAPPARRPDRSAWLRRLSLVGAVARESRHYEPTNGVPFERVAAAVDRWLPDDEIVTADAGSFGVPIYRQMRFGFARRLLAPISGAMGFGVPAAIAAALRFPRREVCCFVGDGGFLMTGNELAVGLKRDLRLTVVVAENRAYGSIRLHQERNFGGKVIGTTFANPDLAQIGRAFGYAVSRLASPADLDRLPDILAAGGPKFIVVETRSPSIRPAGALADVDESRSPVD